MIVITGAAGFIGSCLTSILNREGLRNLILADDFSRKEKNINLAGKYFFHQVDRKDFHSWLEHFHPKIDFVFHLGARTDTAETDTDIFDALNLNYSKELWKACTDYQIPLVYASSASTYGAGEHGYSDDHELIPRLKPLNPYGDSKHEMDKWVLRQNSTPPFWAGLKFFNVYGPNEYHKGRMASAIMHLVQQIHQEGKVKLFRSHRPDIADGEQKRDFIYIKDVVRVCLHFMKHHKTLTSGIYNLGTGETRSFNDLATACFHALHTTPEVAYVDTPPGIRDNYQYYTRAEMEKLRRAGYQDTFYSLEEGVMDYVKNYLMEKHYL